VTSSPATEPTPPEPEAEGPEPAPGVAPRESGEPRGRWAERLAERRVAHRRRGRVYRIGFVAAGAVVTLVGAAMLILPGPALLVIPIGLAMLAMEFDWAERLLDRALAQAERAQRTASEASTAQKLLSVVVSLAVIGGLVAWAILGDIPLIPYV
jgi:uncharacterized protein (TIGR02611 family)